jgi:hypothetical protein
MLLDGQRAHALPLMAVLHPSPSATALIEMTGMRGRQIMKQYFTRADVAVECGIDAALNGLNVFVNVNPRSCASSFERDVPFVTALFLDLQYERTTPAEVDRVLAMRGIYAAATAVSGGGEHRYIRLSEPAEPQKAKLVWERLCKFTKSDAVHSLNRIARMPGSLNWKNAMAPRWCYLTAAVRPDCAYTIEQIDDALDKLGAGPARKPIDGIPVPVDPPMDWFELRGRLDAGVLDIIDTGEKNAYSEKQVTRSEADWVVVCALVRAGCPDNGIHWVYERCPVGNMKYREAGPRYLNKTIESARRATAEKLAVSPVRARDVPRRYRGASGEHNSAWYTRR